MDIIDGLKTFIIEIIGTAMLLVAAYSLIHDIMIGGLDLYLFIVYIGTILVGFILMTYKNLPDNIRRILGKKVTDQASEDKQSNKTK